ncbi:MAG: prepilin-type N-terminal cleavage/methylation domain-containing protein [Clostridia bacterium]|nr:prepilin-type N-terminal cleavage/methylation domain-containing protein [Clostridia bacterium]
MKNQKGFTLVELMVVVVIIGILIAIAVPAYSKIKESSEAKACEANMRTIFSAIQVYRVDKKEEPTDVKQLADYFEGAVPTCPSAEDAEDGEYNIVNGKVECPLKDKDHGSYGGDGGSETPST